MTFIHLANHLPSLSDDTSIWHIWPILRFRMFGWEMASAFRSSRVDFIPADDVLEKNFGDENSVKGMYNANESDIDWQLEN